MDILLLEWLLPLGEASCNRRFVGKVLHSCELYAGVQLFMTWPGGCWVCSWFSSGQSC